MLIFEQKELREELERCELRKNILNSHIESLDNRIGKFETTLINAYDEEKKAGLVATLKYENNLKAKYDQELQSLKNKITDIIQKISNEESSNEYQEFSPLSQKGQKNSAQDEESFSPESKVIQELQKEEKHTSKPLANQIQDINAQSLLSDDEIKNTVLYTVTFFPHLSVEDFDQVVAFLLEGQEFTPTPEEIDEEGNKKTITNEETQKTYNWRNPKRTTYKDELLSQCYIEPQQLADSFEEVIDFRENYAYLREEFIELFQKSGFYAKDKFQKVQYLIFWVSEKVVAHAITIAVNMSLSDPNLYGERFLLGIINGLREYEQNKLLGTTLKSLASEQSLEQTIFNINAQKQKSDVFKSLVCERLAALVYKVKEYPNLQGILENFLNQVMQPPYNRFDVVLEICRYLRTAPDFDEMYWIKQILARGDAETRDKAYKFLYSLLKQNKYFLYEKLKVIEEWLPNLSQNPESYSTLNQYALQIFIEYSLEQTSNLDVKYYGEYPSKISLFYSLQDELVEDKLDTLMNFLFCLYLDKSEKYHPEKLALSKIVDKDVKAMDVISFLIAQWYIIMHGLQIDTMNSEASKIFQQLLTKIINYLSPNLTKELKRSWVQFGKHLRNEARFNRKLKQDFITQYNLVKKLKTEFELLEKSIN